MIYDIVILLYMLSLLHMSLFFFLEYKKLAGIANIFALSGFLLNISDIVIKWINTGIFPSHTMNGLLIILTAALVAVYIFLYLKYKRPSLLLFIMPIVIILGLFTFAFKDINPARDFATSFWLYIHLPFTVVGSAFFLFAAISGVMYFVQENQLKNKNFGFIYSKFPPLNVINNLNKNSLNIGFAVFTIGLIAGIIWGLYEWNGTLLLSAKLIFAVITWAVFGIIILIRQTKGLAPRGSALWSVVGFICIVIMYFCVALFLRG